MQRPSFRVWDGEAMHTPPHDYVWDPRVGVRGEVAARGGEIICTRPLDVEVMWALSEIGARPVYEGDLIESRQGGLYLVERSVSAGGLALSTIEGLPEMRWSTLAMGSPSVVGNRYETPERLPDASDPP